MKRSRIKSILALMLVLSLCFSTNITTASAKAKKVKVSSVTVKAPSGSKKVAYVAKGKKIKLATTVKVTPNKAANKKVTYKSANPKIATVTKKGVVKGVKLGKTSIQVISKKNTKKKKTIKIQVTNPVKKVKLNNNSLTIPTGAKSKLKATVTAPKGAYKGVAWATSNKKVATVTKKGVVKGISEGNAKITVKALDGSGKKAVCKVTVATSIKDIEIVNPTKSSYVKTYKVTLDSPKVLTADQFRFAYKTHSEGKYNNYFEVEEAFTSDNKTYTIITEIRTDIGNYVQVSIPSLKGKNSAEKQILTQGETYTSYIIGKVGGSMSNYVEYYNAIGEVNTTIKSGKLPAGLSVDKYDTTYIKGIPTATANNHTVVFAGEDELGRKMESKVVYAIGSEKVLATANKTYGDKLNNRIYEYSAFEGYISVIGGSGRYNVELTDDCGGKFVLESSFISGRAAYIDSVSDKLTAGTYNVKVKFTDRNNTSLSTTATMTVVVTRRNAVTVNVANWEREGDIVFYNYDLDRAFYLSGYSYGKTTDREYATYNTKTKAHSEKILLPQGRYVVYAKAYGKTTILQNNRTINGTTIINYNYPTKAKISGSILDKNGNKFLGTCDLRIYKSDDLIDAVGYAYYTYHSWYMSEEFYKFEQVPNGTYVVKVFDDNGLVVGTSGTITVTGGDVKYNIKTSLASEE